LLIKTASSSGEHPPLCLPVPYHAWQKYSTTTASDPRCTEPFHAATKGLESTCVLPSKRFCSHSFVVYGYNRLTASGERF